MKRVCAPIYKGAENLIYQKGILKKCYWKLKIYTLELTAKKF